MRIRYKIKIQTPEIIINAAAIVLFGLFASSSNAAVAVGFLAACFILLFAAIHRPRRLFTRRLNSFFAVVHYPLCKWHPIYEMPTHKQKYVLSKLSCKEYYKQLAHQMTDMFSFIDTEHGYYRTITHKTIADRILKYRDQGKLEIITFQPAYRKNLLKIQDSLLYHKCRKCSEASHCRYRSDSKIPRQFYYIEFHVPKSRGGSHK